MEIGLQKSKNIATMMFNIAKQNGRLANKMSHKSYSTCVQTYRHQFSHNHLLTQQQMRFFSSKQEKLQEEEKEKKEEEVKLKEEVNELPSDKQTKQSDKKTQQDSSSSSDDDTPSKLSAEDIKKIKKLIAEQDKEIEKLKELSKQLKEKLVYQLAENDNTVKRYKKEIDSTKEFAISKFAKDLLDVRDNLQMANDHIKKLKITPQSKTEELLSEFIQVVKGMEMTSSVMDACLKRFGVVQFNPKGEKFDPNNHEAIFTIPAQEGQQPNTIGEVMQTGWKIGDRLLRAAKVGIVKK